MSEGMRVTVLGPPSLADALTAQGARVRLLPPRPEPAGPALGQLVVAYADDRIAEANARVLEHLQTSRPVLAGVAPAGLLLPAAEPRWVLSGGPPCEWDRLPEAQRRAAAATCVLEGWAADMTAAEEALAGGGVRLGSAMEAGAAAPGAMAVGPSTPCWLVRDDASGATAVAPVLHGGPHALWLGDVSPESLRRERILGETAAPALAAALRATGPVDVYARCAEALLAGDDGHARTSGLSLILLRDLLPALAGRAAHAVHAVALLAPGDGLGLSAAVGAARATLAGASGAPASSLLTCVAGDGEGVAVQLAGMPGRWFSARGAPPVDGSGRALAHVGDAALVELVGLGAATAAAAVPLGPGGAPEGAVAAAARAAEVAGVALERSRRFAPPGLDGDGAPLGVDARACLDLRTAPSMAQPALARVHGAEPAVRLLRVPLGALSDALSSLIYGLEG